MECVVCHTDFPAKRRSARYCSRRCAKRAQRMGIAASRVAIDAKPVEPSVRPRHLRKPTVEDLTRLIVDAHTLEAGFRFAAKEADYRYRPMCSRLADRIASALDEEGLR